MENFDIKNVNPGIYDISNEQYHSSIGLSRSALWEFNALPKKYWHKYLSGQYKEPKESDALLMGNLVHTMVLEQHKFQQQYYVMPKVDGRTKEGIAAKKIALSESVGKILINEEQYEMAFSMSQSIFSDEMALETLKGAKVEQSIYWTDEETGLLCKARPDIWRGPIAGDLKTAKDASPRAFQYDAMKRGYFLQAAMMYEAFKANGMPFESFVFICVEKEAPYATALYALDEEALTYGRELFHNLLRKFKHCLDTNTWPAYGVQTLYAPNYLLTEMMED